MATRTWQGNIIISNSPVSRALFSSTRWAWLWLIVRVYVGYTWLNSGWGKLSNPAWSQTGEALKGFWQRAAVIPEAPARPLIAFDWYRLFIQALLDSSSYVWFAKLVVAGEILIGIALILGAFAEIAAFFGGFMNWNFMMAGSASINPVLFSMAILIILAWKTAGWWGADRWLLPLLGSPWQPGRLFNSSATESQ